MQSDEPSPSGPDVCSLASPSSRGCKSRHLREPACVSAYLTGALLFTRPDGPCSLSTNHGEESFNSSTAHDHVHIPWWQLRILWYANTCHGKGFRRAEENGSPQARASGRSDLESTPSCPDGGKEPSSQMPVRPSVCSVGFFLRAFFVLLSSCYPRRCPVLVRALPLELFSPSRVVFSLGKTPRKTDGCGVFFSPHLPL